MTGLAHAQSYRDLVAYQKAQALALEIFRLTQGFPREEAYALTDQLRRCSRSVGAQVAEAWGKRPYEKHFVSKLTDADAELQETQHWLETARDCGYLAGHECAGYIERCSEIGRLLHGMIAKAALFCGSRISLSEDQAGYFA